MKVLIVGSKGQLGKEITRQFQSRYELSLYDIPSLDITNYPSVESIISDTNPAVVINAAAYTNVEKAEEDEDTAFGVNALGAQNLALACKKYRTKLVHISTDYVFDGKATIAYQEFARVGKGLRSWSSGVIFSSQRGLVLPEICRIPLA